MVEPLRPYHGLLFNLHKLIALGTVILTALRLFEALKSREAGLVSLILFGAAALCVAALFASGAFLSTGSFEYRRMKGVHQVALVVVAPALLTAVYLLAAGTP